MKSLDIAFEDAPENTTPELRVVTTVKKAPPPAPLTLPSRVPSRQSRSELTVLGWAPRANRLQRTK